MLFGMWMDQNICIKIPMSSNSIVQTKIITEIYRMAFEKFLLVCLQMKNKISFFFYLFKSISYNMLLCQNKFKDLYKVSNVIILMDTWHQSLYNVCYRISNSVHYRP